MGKNTSWHDVSAIVEFVCARSADYLQIDGEVKLLLRALRDKGLQTPMVSNYDHPPEVRRFLETSRLAALLEPFVISGKIGIWKPDPRILTTTLTRIEARPSDVLHVRNSRVHAVSRLGEIPDLLGLL